MKFQISVSVLKACRLLSILLTHTQMWAHTSEFLVQISIIKSFVVVEADKIIELFNTNNITGKINVRVCVNVCLHVCAGVTAPPLHHSQCTALLAMIRSANQVLLSYSITTIHHTHKHSTISLCPRCVAPLLTICGCSTAF